MKLVEYKPEFKQAVLDFQVTEEMAYFTATPEEILVKVANDTHYHLMLAIVENQIVTLFVLDDGGDRLIYTDEKESILVRAFSTDARHQRKGYAQQALALIPSYINEYFPKVKEIVLAVNVGNLAGQKLYKKAGYQDTGKRVEGRNGDLICMTYPVATEVTHEKL